MHSICGAHSNSSTVHYYSSTNNLIFVINFNRGAPLNSAAHAIFLEVSDG